MQGVNGIILRMDVDGRITFANKYAQQFFGYSEQELLGQSVIGTIVPTKESTGRDLVAMMENILRSPEQYHYNENENMRKGPARVGGLEQSAGFGTGRPAARNLLRRSGYHPVEAGSGQAL